MSNTMSQDHRANPVKFTEPHGVEPGVTSTILGFLGLALIVAGDYASFNIALSRSFADMGTLTVLILTLAMTAAAVLLMYEAGRSEAIRRSRNSGRTGRGPVRWRIGAWLLLGLTAFTLRMAAPPETTDSGGFGTGGSTGGFGSAPAATGGFGQASDAATSTLVLGPLTLHAENLASALALLAIFVAGGVGAFFLGKESHNPLLTDVRRRRRAERRARRRLGTAQRRHDRAHRRAADRTAGLGLYRQSTLELDVLADLEHQIDLYGAAAAELTRSTAATHWIAADSASTQTELDSLADELRLTQRQTEHAGARAKEVARVLIAEYRGEPAATSGLTNGTDR